MSDLLPDESDLSGTQLGRCASWPYDFEIRCRDTEVLRWARAHLERGVVPPGEVPSPETVSVSVAWGGSVAGRLTDEIRRSAGEPVEGYAGEFWETGTVRGLPAWCRQTSGGADVIVRTGERGWFLASPTRVAVALGTVRLCREIVRMRLVSEGALVVHGATLTRPDLGGLLLVGPPHVGKTTLALCLAQHQGGVVDSDQTYLLPSPYGGRVMGAGTPNAHRVGPGTLGRLDPRGRTANLAFLRDGTSDFPGNPSPDKRWITPLEAEVLYGIATVARATVDRIVVMTAEQGVPQATTAPLPDAVMRERLKSEFRASDPLYAAFWLAPPGTAPVPLATAGDLFRLVDRVPVIGLTWDPTRHSTEDVASLLRQPASALYDAVRG